ncbi:MAG: AI-2E family transporter [Cyclobacteriaceae bacterium]|jgi:predicted PurR-regulated permease PerM
MQKYAFIRKYNSIMIFLIITVAVLILARQILVPMAWAIYLALVTYPIANRLERWRMNRVISSLFIVFALVLLLVIIVLFFSSEIIGFSTDITLTGDRIESIARETLINVEEMVGVKVASTDNLIKSGMENLGGWLVKELSVLGTSITGLTLMLVYLFFFLYYRSLFRHFMTASYTGDRLTRMKDIVLKSSHIASGYIRGTMVLTLMMAVLALIIFWIFGIRHAFFLAFFVAVLNIIPYIGNLIAFAVVFLVVFVTKDSVGISLGVLGCLYVANLLQENIGRPLIVGSEMDMNGFFVFVSVVIGGTIWGISGMILFIPITAVLKIALEVNPHWQPTAILFGSLPKPLPVTPTTTETEISEEK